MYGRSQKGTSAIPRNKDISIIHNLTRGRERTVLLNALIAEPRLRQREHHKCYVAINAVDWRTKVCIRSWVNG